MSTGVDDSCHLPQNFSGESGQVDQSMAELAKAEALKAEKLEKERELQQLTGE